MEPRAECPRPDKAPFATQVTADRRALFLTFYGDSGTPFWTYLCVCGWYHLTTKLPPKDTRTGRDQHEPE